MRRHAMVSLLAAGMSIAALNANDGVVKGAERMSGLLHNEDCTDFFYTQTFPPGQAGALTDRYVDVIADAGVTVLFCNTNARRTNYRSAVWEAFWDGYDPEGPDDQPFLAPISEKSRGTFRKLVHNMWEVHRQGVDYPARVVERCRQRGISPWISLRMNDAHYNDTLDHPFHGSLWRNSTYFRRGHPGYYARCLDYSHSAVRDLFQALVAETLERYDIDGLELDFMREPYVFSAGEETGGLPVLTQWLRHIRVLVDQAAERRGHPIGLGVRVPPDPETALGLGLDVPAWSREGLVDLVVVTPRWRTTHFDMPLGRWRELLGERVTLAGGLESRCQPVIGGPVHHLDPEYDVGAAVAVLSSGADVVYLFNHFQNGAWPIADYTRRLQAYSSLEALCRMPRRHTVTPREVIVPGQAYQPPLPAKGGTVSVELPLGPAPPADWRADATIEITAADGDDPVPELAVNGVVADLSGRAPVREGRRLLTYSMSREALSGTGRDRIEVRAGQGALVDVRRIDIRFAPR